MLANVRSIFKKIDHLRVLLSTYNCDIFCATETWLHQHHTDNIIAITGYKIYRDDRSTPSVPGESPTTRVGGGVAVWVKLNIDINVQRYIPPTHLIGSQEIWLVFKNINLLLITVYIPPEFANTSQYSADINNHFINNCDIILAKSPDLRICLTGDFNRLNCADFNDNLSLVDCVNQPTRGNVILDRFFCSEEIVMNYNVRVQAPLQNSDHNIVFAQAINQLTSHRNPILQTVFDLRESHVSKFCSVVEAINWHDFYLTNADVDFKCNIFHEIINSIIEDCIPSTIIISSEADEPWVTPVLKSIMLRRDEAFLNNNALVYEHLCNKVNNEITKSKRIWASKAEKGSRQLWRVAHNVSGTNKINPITKLYNKFPDIETAANRINIGLSNIFTQPSTYNLPATNNVDLEWNCPITVDQVYKAMKSLHPSKAYGNDLIPTLLYKSAAASLAEPLAHIFNMSIQDLQFPSPWKYGHTIVLPKTADPEVTDTRPITLLTIPSKILERFALNSVLPAIRDDAGSHQFCKSASSTLCALVTLHDHVTILLDIPAHYGVCIISYDFAKCFDKLSHDVILKRLIECHYPPDFIKWTKSYLSNRTQSVRIGNCISPTVNVTSGVPQGSVLGLPLWNLVAGSYSSPVNDSNLCEFITYADDFTFIFPLLKNNDNSHISTHHDQFLSWASANKLILNLGKCKILNVIPPGTNMDLHHTNASLTLPIVDELRLLGVVFNSRLNWQTHISLIVRSASQRLYAIRKLRPLVSDSDLTTIYNATIRSVLEYCSPLFIAMPAYLDQNLHRIQSRFHAILCGPYHTCSTDDCLQLLTERRNLAATKLFNKVTNDNLHVLRPLLPQISERSGRFIVPFAATNRRQSSLFVHMVSRQYAQQ
jgi:ribonuclease P/MRP protein subunit RPP40